MKVLVSDRLHDVCHTMLRDAGLEVVDAPGADPSRLAELCRDVDGWIIRSGTKVTADLMRQAGRLRAIGRAGVGVDNVDLEAATRRGVLVLNAPAGNTISTAEHTLALLMAMVRNVAPAASSVAAGRWDRKLFTGAELYGKTVGIVGVGKIGRAVAERLAGFGVKLIGFDPVLSNEQADRLGLKLVPLDDIFELSDYITVHTPLTSETRGLLGSETLARCKKGVGIVNCARGGIVDEAALLEALNAGHVGSAALDVYSSEPPGDELRDLLAHPRVVATPHIAASTGEAQEKVARQVTEQLINALADRPVTTAVNAMAIRMASRPDVRPFVELAEKLGRAAAQMRPEGFRRLRVRCHGETPRAHADVLRIAALRGFLSEWLSEPVNFVNAPVLAEEMGLDADIETFHSNAAFSSLVEVRLDAATESGGEARRVVSLQGAIFAGNEPRITAIDDTDLELRMSGSILVYRNVDRPGMLAAVGSVLAHADINIASMALGREAAGETALTAIGVDSAIPDAVRETVSSIDGIERVQSIVF
ncbi:MAG: phosphoglycerate dehydrogenase [Rhodothermales bacterium]|nr:phosphoglycerate dehydrogenase [Rhodothermales bacterium]